MRVSRQPIRLPKACFVKKTILATKNRPIGRSACFVDFATQFFKVAKNSLKNVKADAPFMQLAPNCARHRANAVLWLRATSDDHSQHS